MAPQLLIKLVSIAGIAAFSASSSTPKNAAASDQRSQSKTIADKTIVSLRSRDRVITVTSTPSGVVYSANDARGNSIATGKTLPELRRTHPDIAREVDSAVTGYAGMDGN